MLACKNFYFPPSLLATALVVTVPLFLGGCLTDELDSSPVKPRPVDGIFLIDGGLTFSPCGYPERWFVTPDSVAMPGEHLVRAPSDRLTPFSTAGVSKTGSSFDRTDSLSQPPPTSDTLSSFQSIPSLSEGSLAASLPEPDSVDLDTVTTLHGEVRGYGSEHAAFGPLGRFDRVFVASSVSDVGVGRSCPLLAW